MTQAIWNGFQALPPYAGGELARHRWREHDLVAKGDVPTQPEIDEIHATLNRATLALDGLVEARVTGNEAAAQGAIDRMSTELGGCKYALRVVHPDEPEAKDAKVAGEAVDPMLRMVEHAAEMRAKAMESLVTVASGALALSVTFRSALVRSAPDAVWLLKLSWIAFALCVVFVLAERFVTSTRMVAHAVAETFPSTCEKWTLAVLFFVSLLTFAIGIGALAAFGWVNL